jgi:membrane protein DedA with SNARE-associated domain
MSAIERIFARYGSATVLFARFFSILRQLNGIVAGTLGMSWWRMIQNEKGRETAK